MWSILRDSLEGPSSVIESDLREGKITQRGRTGQNSLNVPE